MGPLTLKKGVKLYHLQHQAISNELLLQNIELYCQPACELAPIPFLQKTTANPVVGSRRKSAREDWEQQPSFGSSSLVPVSSSLFCFEGEPEKPIMPNPLPTAFYCCSPKTLELLGRCFPQSVQSVKSPFSFPSPWLLLPRGDPWRGLPQPARQSRLSTHNICFSHLSQFVCACFKILFFLLFQLFSPLVATSVLSSCYLFRHGWAGSIPICWQQPPAFPSFVCMDIPCILVDLMLLKYHWSM